MTRLQRNTVVSVLTVAVVASATLALASGGGEGHGGNLLKDFLYRILNFAIMIGLLAYFVAKPFKNGMANRRESIEKALEEARKAQADAEAKFAEYDAKLAAANEEIEELSAAIGREGELERKNILENAEKMAAKIEQDADRNAELAVSKARAELRQEAAVLAVELAKGLLEKNFTADDQKRLVDEYIEKVGELQ
ncbi:MAG: ATPase [Desulfuromonas sp.]|nr:MAG: ATPase [Desulfuromonas sp.]